MTVSPSPFFPELLLSYKNARPKSCIRMESPKTKIRTNSWCKFLVGEGDWRKGEGKKKKKKGKQMKISDRLSSCLSASLSISQLSIFCCIFSVLFSV